MTNQPEHSGGIHANYRDHEVVDADGNDIGTVTDVLYDDKTLEPAWFVVNPGLLKAERYVPVEGSYTTDDGKLVVPFDKRWLKSAPKASHDHVITLDDEKQLAEHYGTRRS